MHYNVCDDSCESDLNDNFDQIFPDCKYHLAKQFNTCNRNPLCLPDVSVIHLNAGSLNCNFRQIEDCDCFSEHVEQPFLDLSLHKSNFLCGDFNIDILKNNSNRGIKYFLDTMYAIGLYPLIDRPTRISNQSFSLVDTTFTNVTNYNITSGILTNDITDHLLVFAICTYPNPNRQTKKLYIKNVLSMTTLIGNLTNICWTKLMYSMLSKWSLLMHNSVYIF